MKHILSRILLSILLLNSPLVHAYLVNLESMTNDINFLTDDKLKGRAAGSDEIKLAANYIAKRFEQIGLDKLKNQTSFFQSFSLYQFELAKLNVKLNANIIDDKQLALVSNQIKLHWQTLDNLKTSYVKAEDNLYQHLAQINAQGGQHIVLVNKAHQKLFSRFKRHFSRSTRKFNISEPTTLLLVLSDETNIEKIEVNAQFNVQKQTLNNVVGVLPGQNHADEYIIFSAHYDHIGTLKTVNNSKNDNDIIFNGADDDASGTTAVMQLAEYLKAKGDNQRSIIFVAFTAEEIGGYGSQFFAKQLPADAIKAMINMEMIGKPSKFGDGTVWMTGYGRSNLATLMNEQLTALNKNEYPTFQALKIHQDPYPKQNLFYRSDNATLARLGVAAHSFSSTQLDKDPHYHRVSDEVKTLNLTSMKKVIETIALASQGLLSGKQTPTRVDTSRVRNKGKIF